MRSSLERIEKAFRIWARSTACEIGEEQMQSYCLTTALLSLKIATGGPSSEMALDGRDGGLAKGRV